MEAKKENNEKARLTPPAKNNVGVKRFRIVLLLMCLAGIIILGSAIKTMVTKRDYWEEVRKQFTTTDIVDPAIRGNIYDCKNRLLVGSVPEYRICMDFLVIDKDEKQRASAQAYRDSVFLACRDTLAAGLHEIFPDYTAEFFLQRLNEGFERKKNGWSILPKHMASYIEFQECKKLPLFCEKAYKGGFHGDEVMKRKKPYGSLASRTLGSLKDISIGEKGEILTDEQIRDSAKRSKSHVKVKTKVVAKNGIELAYDTILKGTDGVKHNSKVRNARVDFIDKAPINGHDLMVTIDVDIQDIAEKALMAQLKSLGPNAEMGCVIVMEAKTGDVKAMVNLGRDDSGNYAEIMNYAISERSEPGSTFKTASIMAAIEDGKVDTGDVWNIYGGIYNFYGKSMIDASRGHSTLSVKRIMEKSSNVGVSRIITESYGKNPQAFIDALKREGAGIPLGIKLEGAREPIMKTDPNDKENWWKTTLPWMSIGYESLLPPISTCTFYNGIANNGKLMKPRFVKAEMQDGKVIREFPTEVLREQMCSPQTLQKIREVLENVVSARGGTGKKARCEKFRVAGKTGTAQIAAGKSGYKNGKVRYLISFCGFFPYENPQYTCLVCIRKIDHPASGGTMCGPVFAQVAQAVMATSANYRNIEKARDSIYKAPIPSLRNGNAAETKKTLDELHIDYKLQPDTAKVSDKAGLDVWYVASNTPDSLTFTTLRNENGKMPNVMGMGARDAVYAIRSAGLKVKLKGAGHVTSQSIAPGTACKKGATVSLTLE